MPDMSYFDERCQEKDRRIFELEETIEGLIQRLWILVQRQGGKVGISDKELIDVPRTAVVHETRDTPSQAIIIRASKGQ